MRCFTALLLVSLLCSPLADAQPLVPFQYTVLYRALRIGRKLHLGPRLAAIAYQESSLGKFPDSPGHYGVGSCSWYVWNHVLKAHPWLQRYFAHRNWATVLVQNPTISLWVAGYWLLHCRQVSGSWPRAFAMYRYGAASDSGRYAHRIDLRLAALRTFIH